MVMYYLKNEVFTYPFSKLSGSLRQQAII